MVMKLTILSMNSFDIFKVVVLVSTFLQKLRI